MLYIYLKFKLRLPKDKENMQTTIESVRTGATMSGAYLWVLVLAIFTASLGLNVNSTAVIIGAMLISPLMGPIIAIGMGVAINDFGLVYRAFKNFALAVGLSILTSSLYFFISPLKVPGSELLARTSPTVYDVLIAIVGGLAGIVAGSTRLRQSNVIPGVAIATALMPPLCTVGFGIANLQGNYVVGALYLFFINSVFICLSTYFIVRILGYPAVEEMHGQKAIRVKRAIWSLVMVTLLPSIYLTYQIVRQYVFEERAKTYVQREFSDKKRIVLKTETNFKTQNPGIMVTMLGAVMDSLQLDSLERKLPEYGLGNAKLEINQNIGQVISEGVLGSRVVASQETHGHAINQLYRELDSLKFAASSALESDTLQASLGRELGILFPDLQMFQLGPHFYFDVAMQQNREGWMADIKFSKRQSTENVKRLRDWLTLKLPGDTLFLKVN
jgi:uncharacterized hydrophobic protein (TIGR00271 family)